MLNGISTCFEGTRNGSAMAWVERQLLGFACYCVCDVGAAAEVILNILSSQLAQCRVVC
jgi:hypothetical protein